MLNACRLDPRPGPPPVPRRQQAANTLPKNLKEKNKFKFSWFPPQIWVTFFFFQTFFIQVQETSSVQSVCDSARGVGRATRPRRWLGRAEETIAVGNAIITRRREMQPNRRCDLRGAMRRRTRRAARAPAVDKHAVHVRSLGEQSQSCRVQPCGIARPAVFVCPRARSCFSLQPLIAVPQPVFLCVTTAALPILLPQGLQLNGLLLHARAHARVRARACARTHMHARTRREGTASDVLARTPHEVAGIAGARLGRARAVQL